MDGMLAPGMKSAESGDEVMRFGGSSRGGKGFANDDKRLNDSRERGDSL